MLARLLLSSALLFVSLGAQATVRCVSDINGLNAALDDANNVGAEGSTWDIRLQAKTYILSGDVIFDPPGDKDNKTFYFSGGWNSTCSKQITSDASATVLRGVKSTPNKQGTRFIFYGDNARFELSLIRFEQFSIWNLSDKFCSIGDICPDTDALIAEHLEIHDGEEVFVEINDAKKSVFRNNLVDHINRTHDLSGEVAYNYIHAPVSFAINNSEDAPQITFNTFADIQCGTSNGAVGLRADHPSVAVHHNIIRSSCTDDIYAEETFGGKKITLWNNLYLNPGSGIYGDLTAQGNVVTADPKFVNAGTGNYHLQSLSPAVNAGKTLTEAVLANFQLSFADLDGNPRPFGQHFDIGGYESFVNDGAPITWKVTNTSDEDIAGSLRRAINNSNAQVTGGQHIVFDIQTGTCPHTILLKSPLPDITHSVWIDGYSQPGSTKNTYPTGSNAKICVAIAPGVSNIGHAIAMPAGGPQERQLRLEGLGFGGGFFAFTDSAVDLQSGNYHFITGNAFGGTLPSSGGGLGGLPNAIRVRGGAVFVTVGGSDPAERNYFGSLSGSGIRFDGTGPISNLVQNNYFGVTPDALTAQSITGCGVSVYGGFYSQIDNNTFDAANCGVELRGATTQSWRITGNRIGVSPYGSTLAQFSNTDGIYINEGANQNYIGAAPGEQLNAGALSNDIRNNNYYGVQIADGTSTSVRGNRISANGRAIPSIGIQMGNNFNLQPNDVGDPDAGANALQNYPVLKGSGPNGVTRQITALLNSEPNQQFRLDFYRSKACAATNRPDADVFVGSADATSDATGTIRVIAQVTTTGAPGFLTATATSLGAGNTSELAPCLDEDTIFRDGMDL